MLCAQGMRKSAHSIPPTTQAAITSPKSSGHIVFIGEYPLLILAQTGVEE